MSEPAPTTGRGDARIVARGFARYDGPRSGVPGAIRSVAWQSIRATLGIGRLARHKIFPIISVAIAYVPAIVFVGISVLLPEEIANQVVDYPGYYGFITAAIAERLIFCPLVELVPVASNAEGARRARDEKDTAAIAGDTAAEVYGLTVLVAEIEDRPDNTTRFLVVGRKLFAPSGVDRTSIIVSGGHTDAPGALYRLLEPLAKHRINVTRIESRPSGRRKWDYVFFLDIEGHAAEPRIAKALASLKKRASLFRVLGAYPRAIQ